MTARRTGATAVGARDFLIAYNINLNTTSSRRANAIAFDIREAGRIKKRDGITGPAILDENGEPVRIPGTLKSVKGIGWYIEEYGIAQLSLNLTDINVTPVHVAFDEACNKAQARGIRVTGSELVGLLPLRVLLDAADHYLRKQQRSLGISEAEKVKIAVKSLGLDDLAPFDPAKRVIEYIIAEEGNSPLIHMTLTQFADTTASEAPAPGGGSISAYAGALGAALATMVANLSAHKRGWDDRWEEFSVYAEKGLSLQNQLMALVDADTQAFDAIMAAYGMPKGTDDQKAKRHQAIQDATRNAIDIPMQVAQVAHDGLEPCGNHGERRQPQQRHRCWGGRDVPPHGGPRRRLERTHQLRRPRRRRLRRPGFNLVVQSSSRAQRSRKARSSQRSTASWRSKRGRKIF